MSRSLRGSGSTNIGVQNTLDGFKTLVSSEYVLESYCALLEAKIRRRFFFQTFIPMQVVLSESLEQDTALETKYRMQKHRAIILSRTYLLS